MPIRDAVEALSVALVFAVVFFALMMAVFTILDRLSGRR